MTEVLLCGSSFGAVYAAAIDQASDLKLLGIRAQGSRRSLELAKHYGVPVFTANDQLSPAQIGNQARVAAVVLRSGVLGGHGVELAKELLSTGWHVLIEQPVRADELKQLAGLATKEKRALRVGNLYLNLPAVSRFLQLAKGLAKDSQLRQVRVSCSSQTLLPAAAVLRRTLGSGACKISHVEQQQGFVQLIGTTANIGWQLQVFHEHDPADRDNGLLALVGAELVTTSGVLALPDAAGPVLWYPRMMMNFTGANGLPHDLDAELSRGYQAQTGANLGFAAWLMRDWTAAIATDLRATSQDSVTGVDRKALADSIADATWWTQLGAQIGLPAQNAHSTAARLSVEWFQTH